MRRTKRWTLFLLLLAGSVLISVVATLYFQAPFLTLFLFFPFLPFVFGGRGKAPPRRTCPACGYETDDPLASFCPRDASRLTPSQPPD